jgi:predicted acyltransferase
MVVYGMNAIAVFVASGMLTKTLVRIRVGGVEPAEAQAESTRREEPSSNVEERFIGTRAWVKVAEEECRGLSARQRSVT